MVISKEHTPLKVSLKFGYWEISGRSVFGPFPSTPTKKKKGRNRKKEAHIIFK